MRRIWYPRGYQILQQAKSSTLNPGRSLVSE
jgi:hypothetical protein